MEPNQLTRTPPDYVPGRDNLELLDDEHSVSNSRPELSCRLVFRADTKPVRYSDQM